MGFTPKNDKRFLKQEKAIVGVWNLDKKSRQLVSIWQDLDVLGTINKAVKPLKEFQCTLRRVLCQCLSYITLVI